MQGWLTRSQKGVLTLTMSMSGARGVSPGRFLFPCGIWGREDMGVGMFFCLT